MNLKIGDLVKLKRPTMNGWMGFATVRMIRSPDGSTVQLLKKDYPDKSKHRIEAWVNDLELWKEA